MLSASYDMTLRTSPNSFFFFTHEAHRIYTVIVKIYIRYVTLNLEINTETREAVLISDELCPTGVIPRARTE